MTENKIPWLLKWLEKWVVFEPFELELLKLNCIFTCDICDILSQKWKR